LFEVPVRLIGGRLSGVTLRVNSFEQLVSQSIDRFTFCGRVTYGADFVPLRRPIGFFYHYPIDSTDQRLFVTCDSDLQRFIDVHAYQPLLLFRGSTPPLRPTPPSSPEHPKVKSSSLSSRKSVSDNVRDYLYLRDRGRCCFTGEILVRPKIGGPNQQILHLFPATTTYDPEEKELQQLPIWSRSDPRNLFLAGQDFNTFVDSGAIRVSPDYTIHINDPALMISPRYRILNGKPLLLPQHSSRDSHGMPIVDGSISPKQRDSFLSSFPPPAMFAWHWNFIETTRVLPNRLQELKLSNSCCPDCSTKSKCKTIRCHCRKDHKLCSHCISKKCENKGDAKEEEGGGAELDDDEEAE